MAIAFCVSFFKPIMSQDWSDKEVALVVEDYFAMLRHQGS